MDISPAMHSRFQNPHGSRTKTVSLSVLNPIKLELWYFTLLN